MNKLKRFDSAGDTIVEVMIVLAVLGSAISISYATANRSLLNARQAQEASQATELIQSQIEALRTMTTATAPNNIFLASSWPTSPPYKCLSQTAPYTITSSCNAGTIPYKIAVTYTSASADPANPDKFVVTATWPDVLGQGNDTATIIYRLHKP